MNTALFSFLLFVSSFSFSLLSAQVNILNASFYSESLQEQKSVDIYLPPGYDENTDLYYPVIYFLHGWGGSQHSAETIMYYADSLIRYEIIDPVVIVCANNGPDPFNGSFFMNSPLWGDYEFYNTLDLIEWIESMGRAMPYKGYRALMGQSMGGFGCFKLGVEHKEKFRAIAAHGSPLNFDMLIGDYRQKVVEESGSGWPYFYDFENAGLFTKLVFAISGAFSPNINTPQEYINPRLVEYPINPLGILIDTVYSKWKPHDPVSFIGELTNEDSLAILFGAGHNDELLFFNPNVAFKDTLEKHNLTYEFFEHYGTHGMPDAFKDRALRFIDSILPAPTPNVGVTSIDDGLKNISIQVFPNPVSNNSTIRYIIPETEKTKITVIDLIRQEMIVLLKEVKMVGHHSFNWNTQKLNPGIYFVQIRAGGKTETVKVIRH